MSSRQNEERLLGKLEAEAARLTRELELYKNAPTLSSARSEMIDYVKANEVNDPFCAAYSQPNPFRTSPGGGGAGCCG